MGFQCTRACWEEEREPRRRRAQVLPRPTHTHTRPCVPICCTQRIRMSCPDQYMHLWSSFCVYLGLGAGRGHCRGAHTAPQLPCTEQQCDPGLNKCFGAVFKSTLWEPLGDQGASVCWGPEGHGFRELWVGPTLEEAWRRVWLQGPWRSPVGVCLCPGVSQAAQVMSKLPKSVLNINFPGSELNTIKALS